jgi:hypothetical protein
MPASLRRLTKKTTRVVYGMLWTTQGSCFVDPGRDSSRAQVARPVRQVPYKAPCTSYNKGRPEWTVYPAAFSQRTYRFQARGLRRRPRSKSS